MTLLGITLHNFIKWDTHILGMIMKANTKKYFLVTLKCAGTTTKHLLKFYVTFIQPGLEYAAPMWHPSIAQTLSDNIEWVQHASLHIIFPELSYEHALNKTGLPTLQQLCLRFARSLYDNPNFRHWFPPQRQNIHKRNLRNNNSSAFPHANHREHSMPQSSIFRDCSVSLK